MLQVIFIYTDLGAGTLHSHSIVFLYRSKVFISKGLFTQQSFTHLVLFRLCDWSPQNRFLLLRSLVSVHHPTLGIGLVTWGFMRMLGHENPFMKLCCAVFVLILMLVESAKHWWLLLSMILSLGDFTWSSASWLRCFHFSIIPLTVEHGIFHISQTDWLHFHSFFICVCKCRLRG